MNHDQSPEGGEAETAEDQIAYLNDLVLTLAQETATRYALQAYADILNAPSTDISGDMFYWPYAGPMTEASLCEELTFVFKQAGVDQLEFAYERHVTQFASRVADRISDAEEDLLWHAILHGSNRSMTTTELEKAVTVSIAEEIIRIAKDYDTEGIIEWLRLERIAFRLPSGEEPCGS